MSETVATNLNEDELKILTSLLFLAEPVGATDEEKAARVAEFSGLFDKLTGSLAELMAVKSAEAVAAREAEHRKLLEAIVAEYQNDFDVLSDREIAEESSSAQRDMEEGESWLEAVAAWEALGKPRRAEQAAA